MFIDVKCRPGFHDLCGPYGPALERNVNISLGHLVMDLNHMLRPAKSPEKCNLQLLDQPADRLVSLFEQKTVKGWWPCTCNQNGEKIIAVSTETLTQTCSFISKHTQRRS